ncbi:HIT-like domain-containing protein [Scleroderma yunnanense]
MVGLFEWFFCRKTTLEKRQTSQLFVKDDSDSKARPYSVHDCVFCRSYTSDRGAFHIVWEDADFIAFRDIKPAGQYHVQLIPKQHITSVRDLTIKDVDLVRRMKQIGNEILDQFQVPSTHRKMGFHIPPFNSIHHLHLHVQALPYVSLLRRIGYPVVGGFGPFDKGFSWFVEVGQTTRILERGARVGVFPS